MSEESLNKAAKAFGRFMGLKIMSDILLKSKAFREGVEFQKHRYD